MSNHLESFRIIDEVWASDLTERTTPQKKGGIHMQRNTIPPNPRPDWSLPELDNLGWFLAGIELGFAFCTLVGSETMPGDEDLKDSNEEKHGATEDFNTFWRSLDVHI